MVALPMKRLIVVRHGIAIPRETPGVPDEDRPLTPKGERRIQQVARGLKALDLDPERIVSSPLPRALRTAELIAEVLDRSQRIETSEMLRPEATGSSLRTWLETPFEGGRHARRVAKIAALECGGGDKTDTKS